MDSFNEPSHFDDSVTIDQVRQQVKALEDEHRSRGVQLSGRVIHVCHYLPVIATLNNKPGVFSPPATPPLSPLETKATQSIARAEPSPSASTAVHATASDNKPVWTLTPRYGHAAMISGIRSLSATHEQLIVGWTGDIQSPTASENVPSNNVSEGEKASLSEALESWQPREADPDDDQKTSYVPVWLEDKVAHGHYDEYCKQSKLNLSRVYLPS